MKPQIKHRFTGEVIYEGEAGMTTHHTLEKATASKANLGGANLRGADLGEFGKLVGDRPFFQCGPIGSRSDYLLSFLTDKGVVIKAGCFTGFIDYFRERVGVVHLDNDHAKEYQTALLLIESHAVLWGVK